MRMKVPDEEISRPSAAIALLIEDVISARQRLTGSHPQTARRDVVRASLAAMEGMSWVAREHVRSALAELGQLTPIANLALRELSYSVSEKGKLAPQMRALPLRVAIRLMVEQAKIICPEIAVEFSQSGWSDLERSVDIRNRITHPKPDRDLAISDDDLATVESAVSWLMATVEYVMASTNLAQARFTKQLRENLELMAAGDPDALAEYQAILERSEAED